MEKSGWVEYEEAWESAWDRFVESHPHGRFSHLTGFKKTVETAYQLEPNYWLYIRSGKTLAIFPSFFHTSLIYGQRLVSQPFSEDGGILFAPELEAKEKRPILDEFPHVVAESQKKKRFTYVELRRFADAPAFNLGNFQRVNLYAEGILHLEPDLNLWRHVDPSVRKNLKRARSHGLVLEEGKTKANLLGVFYPLYLRTMKRLGSPPHPLAYFLVLHDNLKDKMKLFLARLDGHWISALLGWAVGKSVHITDIASDERFFPFRANDFLHFELIEWAIRQGFQCFDFGPVRYPGQRQYKKKWGVELREYAYYYFPPHKSRHPLSDRTGAVRFGSAIWRTLVPHGIASRIGKYLRKELSL
ncbi:MAG: GNAT family N-acetyltransferase [Candidatus Aminicenantales bacterium]